VSVKSITSTPPGILPSPVKAGRKPWRALPVFLGLSALAVAAVLVRMHFVPAIDPQFGPFMALGVGVGLMWYALLQMITCTFGPGARSLGGILWPIAFVALGVADVPGPLGIAARALDVINPLAYMEGFSSTSAHTTTLHTNSLWQFPVEERALIVWFFTVLFCAIAIAIWPRKEA